MPIGEFCAEFLVQKDNPSHVSTATDNYKLDLESTSLVHYVEDILSLTRTLKEVWLFGKLNTVGQDERDVKRQQAVEGDWKAMLDMLEANAPLAPATIPEKVDMDEGDEVQGEVKDEEMDGQAEEAQEQSFPDPMETVNSEAL